MSTVIATLILAGLSWLIEPLRYWWHGKQAAAKAVEQERARVAEILVHTQEAEDKVKTPSKADLMQRLDDGTA
jgi:hypothetical protein